MNSRYTVCVSLISYSNLVTLYTAHIRIGSTERKLLQFQLNDFNLSMWEFVIRVHQILARLWNGLDCQMWVGKWDKYFLTYGNL